MLTPDEWMTEIDNGLDYRKMFGFEAAWNKIEANYLNAPSSDTAIGSNLVYSMGDSLLSDLTVDNPEIVVTPDHPMAVATAPVVEAVDNRLIGKLKLRREVGKALLHCYLYGRAILKIGYDSQYGWSPYYDIGEGNNLFGLTLTQFDKKGSRIEPYDITPGMPWVRVADPHDVVVPWGTVDLDDAPWVAIRLIRLNSHLKKDPKYKNTSSLQPSISMKAFMESYRGPLTQKIIVRARTGSRDRDNSQVIYNEFWEIHDRMSGSVIAIAPDHDKFLRNDRDALQVAGMPYVSGTFVQHPRSFWTTPQAYYLGAIQADLYDITKQATKQRRISCLKFLASKNAISADEVNKILSGDVGAVAFADTNRPLSDIFVPFPSGSNLDMVMAANDTRKNARDAIGYSRNQMGEYDTSSRRTAREATFVQMGSQKRTTRRSDVVTGLYVDTFEKVNKIIFQNWNTKRHILIGNDWREYTGRDLQGDYIYNVSLAMKRQVGIAQRKVEALMLMMQLAQFPGVNIPALYKYVIDASADPNFTNILGMGQSMSPAGGGGGAPGGLPTIPATGNSNVKE